MLAMDPKIATVLKTNRFTGQPTLVEVNPSKTVIEIDPWKSQKLRRIGDTIRSNILGKDLTHWEYLLDDIILNAYPSQLSDKGRSLCNTHLFGFSSYSLSPFLTFISGPKVVVTKEQWEMWWWLALQTLDPRDVMGVWDSPVSYLTCLSRALSMPALCFQYRFDKSDFQLPVHVLGEDDCESHCNTTIQVARAIVRCGLDILPWWCPDRPRPQWLDNIEVHVGAQTCTDSFGTQHVYAVLVAFDRATGPTSSPSLIGCFCMDTTLPSYPTDMKLDMDRKDIPNYICIDIDENPYMEPGKRRMVSSDTAEKNDMVSYPMYIGPRPEEWPIECGLETIEATFLIRLKRAGEKGNALNNDLSVYSWPSGDKNYQIIDRWFTYLGDKVKIDQQAHSDSLDHVDGIWERCVNAWTPEETSMEKCKEHLYFLRNYSTEILLKLGNADLKTRPFIFSCYTKYIKGLAIKIDYCHQFCLGFSNSFFFVNMPHEAVSEKHIYDLAQRANRLLISPEKKKKPESHKTSEKKKQGKPESHKTSEKKKQGKSHKKPESSSSSSSSLSPKHTSSGKKKFAVMSVHPSEKMDLSPERATRGRKSTAPQKHGGRRKKNGTGSKITPVAGSSSQSTGNELANESRSERKIAGTITNNARQQAKKEFIQGVKNTAQTVKNAADYVEEKVVAAEDDAALAFQNVSQDTEIDTAFALANQTKKESEEIARNEKRRDDLKKSQANAAVKLEDLMKEINVPSTQGRSVSDMDNIRRGFNRTLLRDAANSFVEGTKDNLKRIVMDGELAEVQIARRLDDSVVDVSNIEDALISASSQTAPHHPNSPDVLPQIALPSFSPYSSSSPSSSSSSSSTNTQGRGLAHKGSRGRGGLSRDSLFVY